ncbi:hypothetical protein KEJ19_06030 [Candidatus Bathyarchaeota archaeon]|nr:hypothetical protein [Candidatus Bathyarchaeota archaeon]
MVFRAREFGFKALGLTVREKSRLRTLKGIVSEAEAMGIQVLTRLDLSPTLSKGFSAEVKWAKGSFDLVAAECLTGKDIIAAAKSPVNILFIDSGSSLGLRERDFKPLVGSQKFFELNLSPLLMKRGLERIRKLSHLMRGLAWLQKLKVPTILSSGAKEPLEMRSPFDMASFFYIAGLSLEEGLKGLSRNPATLIETVKAERDPEEPFPSPFSF